MMTQTVSKYKNLALQKNLAIAPCSGRILIVEDEEDLATLLEYNLKKENYQICIADNGKKALRLVEEIIPDVILLDILLPEMNGWDVCKTVRGNSRDDIASIPIIMLTALRGDEDKFRGLGLGADAFINKPYSVQEVLLHCRNFTINRKRYLELIYNQDSVLGVQKDDLYKLLIHELQNQLTVIGGLAGLLGKKQSPEGQRADCIQIIQRSINYLEDIVQEIKALDPLYRSDNFPSRDTIYLNELIKEVVVLVSPVAHKKNISIQLVSQHIKFHLRQCKTAVKIMLLTILENAVKYSPENTTIKIQLESKEQFLQISVADNGPGIEPEEQTNIFKKFYRTQEAKINQNGTGLGLYLAKKIADSTNATITVQSERGKGSTFTCKFPAKNDQSIS